MQKQIKTLTAEQGISENIYWLEAMRGVWITNWHFMRNLGHLILHAVGARKDARSDFYTTYQWPEERRPIHHRWRGRHRLTVKQNGAMRCTACMLCETVCPCDCIHITPGESPDPHVEKFPERFDIDILRCCFCGLCAEACPVDAIRMDVQDFHLSGYSRDIIYTKDFLMGIDKSKPWEQWRVELEGAAEQRKAS